MRRRFWIPAALLAAVGLALFFKSYSYRFAGFLLCLAAAAAVVFGTVDALKTRFPRAMRWMNRVLLAGLAVFLLLAAATGVWLGQNMQGAAEPAADYAIVLGAGVDGTTPSQALAERLRAAKTYLERYPNAILILSGGQGDYENISEAQCMYDWLTARGVDPARLRREDRASTTAENLAFSLDLIEAETGVRPERIGVISAEYHLLRASLIADSEDVEALCYPARTQNRVFFCNMFLREIFGIWYTLLTL